MDKIIPDVIVKPEEGSGDETLRIAEEWLVGRD